LRIETKQNKDERMILTAMIVDKIVLGRIASKKYDRPFRSQWANLVANWCIKYYKRYQKAPAKNIQGLFESWSEQTQNKEMTQIISKFLSGLSDDYKRLRKDSNSDYVIDEAGKYFNRIKIEKLVETIQSDLDIGKAEEAQERLSAYQHIEMGVGEGIDILRDKNAIESALAEKQRSIIQYPNKEGENELGRFFGHSLGRDCFVSFMGREGIGKSWWLMDICYRAMLQRKRVAFFEVGDQSQNQIMRRLLIRIAKRPIRSKELQYPIGIKKRQRKNEEGKIIKTVKPIFETKEFKGRLSVGKAQAACEKVIRRHIKSKSPYFKLSCHPNDTLTVDGVESIIQDWMRDDWLPDIIAIDYADILNMDYKGIEGRDRINKTWQQLRRLSQTYHCLVLTATQADADSYDKETVSMKNFSDDKRKFSHVTSMIGINQLPHEQKCQMMRLNYLKLRDDEFLQSRCIHIAGCLGLANPAIKSCF